MIPRLLTSILFESVDFNVGPVYHGGTWDGKNPMRVNGRGALGTGAYFSPDRAYVEKYAKESGGQIIETHLKIHKPLEIHMDRTRPEHPCIQALEKLGMKPEKADALVNRVEELKGYMGKEIQSLATKQGYDGIYEFFDGQLKEIVVWSPSQVQLQTKQS